MPLELVLNYDQSWVNGWREPKSMLKKKRTMRPTRNQARILSIIGGRKGISLCTSSWANGDAGPLFISVSAGSLTDKYIDTMNKQLGPERISQFSRESFLKVCFTKPILQTQ